MGIGNATLIMQQELTLELIQRTEQWIMKSLQEKGREIVELKILYYRELEENKIEINDNTVEVRKLKERILVQKQEIDKLKKEKLVK